MARLVLLGVFLAPLTMAVLGVSPPGGGCLWRRSLGVDCPSCGLTRSFLAVGRGDLSAAVRHHPAGPFLFLVAVLVTAGLTAAAAGSSLPGRLWRRAGTLLVTAVAVATVEGWLLKALLR